MGDYLVPVCVTENRREHTLTVTLWLSRYCALPENLGIFQCVVEFYRDGRITDVETVDFQRVRTGEKTSVTVGGQQNAGCGLKIQIWLHAWLHAGVRGQLNGAQTVHTGGVGWSGRRGGVRNTDCGGAG